MTNVAKNLPINDLGNEKLKEVLEILVDFQNDNTHKRVFQNLPSLLIRYLGYDDSAIDEVLEFDYLFYNLRHLFNALEDLPILSITTPTI